MRRPSLSCRLYVREQFNPIVETVFAVWRSFLRRRSGHAAMLSVASVPYTSTSSHCRSSPPSCIMDFPFTISITGECVCCSRVELSRSGCSMLSFHCSAEQRSCCCLCLNHSLSCRGVVYVRTIRYRVVRLPMSELFAVIGLIRYRKCLVGLRLRYFEYVGPCLSGLHAKPNLAFSPGKLYIPRASHRNRPRDG